LKQILIDEPNSWVSLPQKRSKPIFVKKELSDSAKKWLEIHDVTNWSDISLIQNFKQKSIHWNLPGIEVPKDYCGDWKYKGCANKDLHQDGKYFVRATKKSCFRAGCQTCWLEKWLARESSRATRRIEKYSDTWKKMNNQYAECHIFERRRSLKPIHVIVSPSWDDKFISFDLLKKKCRKLLNKAGVKGGLLIYHPFSYNEEEMTWTVRPHFHVIGFGWVVSTKEISDEEGWVIKNKGLRDSLHSTIYYQLSHAGVSPEVHSVTWFGMLGYRAKYAINYKVEKDDSSDFCEYCGFLLVNFTYVGVDRPPDYEFFGSVSVLDWEPLETLEEALNKKTKFNKESPTTRNWLNEDCRLAFEKAESYRKSVEYVSEVSESLNEIGSHERGNTNVSERVVPLLDSQKELISKR